MAAGPLIALAALVGLGALALSNKSKAAAPAPGGAPRSGTFEFDPNLPPQLEAQALGAIKLGTATELRTFSDQLDALGYHLTAAALRQRAAELAPPQPGQPPAGPPIVPEPGPAPAPSPVPSPGPPVVVPPVPTPPPPPPAPGTLSGLDANMDAQTRQAVIAALTAESDPAKLQGFAAAIQFQYPIAAGLLWAKATAVVAQQTPPPVPPSLPAAVPVLPPSGPAPAAPAPASPPAIVPPPLVAPVPAPAPRPVAPPPAPPPPAVVPVPTLTAVQQAAVTMNNALAAHGYKRADMPLYAAFQHAAGLTADGFPGTKTMTALQGVLATMGVAMAPVKVYPWHSRPGTSGYDGVNAPTLAEWQRGALAA